EARLNDPGVEVPPKVQAALSTLKAQIDGLVTATLDAAGEPADPKGVRATLVEALGRAGVTLSGQPYAEPSDDPRYGGLVDLQLERPAAQPKTIAALTTLAIPYGSDNVLTIHGWQGGRWKIAARISSERYEQIDRALDRMRYAISPAGSDGGFT